MSQTSVNVNHVVVVGDGAVGKTTLLHRIQGGDMIEEYYATVYDQSEFGFELDGENYLVKLHDTAGQEEYDRLRRIIYKHANVFLLCYSVDNRESFLNISRWVKELRAEHSSMPIVLCATKTDLRSSVLNCVTTMEGEDARTEIKAVSFVECSAKFNAGVRTVLEQALRAIIEETEEEQDCTCCFINCSTILNELRNFV